MAPNEDLEENIGRPKASQTDEGCVIAEDLIREDPGV
jgi:hypothetical protein